MTTAGEEGSGEILSQDARGRVLVSRERRESLLAEYDRERHERSEICSSTLGSDTRRWPIGLEASVVSDKGKSC